MLIVLYTITPHVSSRASSLVSAPGLQNPVGGPGYIVLTTKVIKGKNPKGEHEYAIDQCHTVFQETLGTLRNFKAHILKQSRNIVKLDLFLTL